MKYAIKSFKIAKSFSSSYKLTSLLKHKDRIKALDNVSFSLENNTVLGVLGPTGSGKTTLLKIISSLIIPDEGSIRIKEYFLGKDDNRIKSVIGYAGSEERSFYWRLTGKQNLEFFASMYGLSRKQTKSRIGHLFKTFRIDYQNRRFDSYSTGMKKIFILMRALLHNPEILLLDELTKSLDYNYLCALKEYVKNLSALGKTIILTTHNIEEAQNLCDKFMILNKGSNCGFGTIESLRKEINSPSAGLSDIYIKLTQNA
ncbi:MAG: hypothetical protein B1H08_04410 [Candidatus Omnitrophica bacterium 4484_171]|nr:MAG: hypothetical protein B1H08_04410 [Candidatus Omnitrophica bacterium 4484_171]